MAGIDGPAAHLSDGLFTTAIAVYALAMVGYTAEFAFGRVARKAVVAEGESAVATAAVAEQPAKVLIGAGGPQSDATAVPQNVSYLVSTDVRASGTVSGGTVSMPPSDPPVGGASRSGRSQRPAADRIGRLAVFVTLIGVLVHLSSITVRAVAVDAVPWSNMYEFASAAGLIAVAAFLIVMIKAPALRFLGGFILLPVILMMFLAGTVLYSKASPLVPALQSYWLAIHVTLVSFAEGALMTSAVLTALFLVRMRYDKKSAKPGFVQRSSMTLAERLPSAETLDKAAYRIVAFAFPLYTVAIICGAIWAEAAWGRYWGWDPKETWAFIVWVVYACYLHARATVGWKGRAAAWVNLLGFACITINFLVVNLVVSGLHSYAGLS